MYDYDSVYLIFVDNFGFSSYAAERATVDVVENGLSIEEAYGKYILELV